MHLMTMGFKGITWGVNPTALRLEWARSLRETVLPFAGSRLTVTASPTLPEPAGLGELSLPELRFTLKEGEVSTRTRMYWEVNG